MRDAEGLQSPVLPPPTEVPTDTCTHVSQQQAEIDDLYRTLVTVCKATGGSGAAGLGSAVRAVFWRGVTHVGGCNQKMLLYASLQICLGRASRMARAGVRENAELETRVAKRC
eukprot:COSAG01_NODE_541_length_15735_cov_4.534088_14_plen_113_part_00